jgi:hypothetical protein
LFVEATFKSLFWWFDNHFKKSEKYENNVFRDVFGFRVFEPYVGDILERNYGKNNVYPSIKYGKPTTDFVDWYVLSNNKVYLYEVKAYQFPLYLLQAINEEKLKIELERKIIKPMIQVYKRIKDIDKYEELKHLRGKKLIPVIIFYNIPLINTSMYNSEIKILLSEIEDRYQGISELEFVLLNIDDLELFEIVSKHTNIEEIYKNAISNQGNFQSQLSDFCEEKNIPENRNSLTEDFYSKKVEYIEKMMSIS